LNFPLTTPEGENLLALQDNVKIDTAFSYCLSQNLDVSHLGNFHIYLGILKISGSGNVIYSKNDLTDWNYDSAYCYPEPSGLLCGIMVDSYKLNSASKTPVMVKFQGSGEIMLSIFISSPSLPGIGGDYRINKFIKW